MSDDEKKEKGPSEAFENDEINAAIENSGEALPESVEDDGAAGDVQINNIEDVDKVLTEADPKFAKEMEEMKASKEDFSSHEVDKAQVEAPATTEDGEESKEKVPPAWLSFLKNLPPDKKLILGGAFGIVFISGLLIALLTTGTLLPKFKLPYIVTMSELSEVTYHYPTDDDYVPLFDDYRSNAFTVAMPEVVINLKPDSSGQRAYGRFEFFINIRDKELAPMVEKRQKEINDLIQRTLERVTWRELQTPVGKERAKKVLRHRINDYFEGNIVIGIYYRTILLNK